MTTNDATLRGLVRELAQEERTPTYYNPMHGYSIMESKTASSRADSMNVPLTYRPLLERLSSDQRAQLRKFQYLMGMSNDQLRRLNSTERMDLAELIPDYNTRHNVALAIADRNLRMGAYLAVLRLANCEPRKIIVHHDMPLDDVLEALSRIADQPIGTPLNIE